MRNEVSIGRMLRVNATRFPDKAALKDARRTFTYGQFQRRVDGLRASLAELGLKQGDRVGILTANCLEIIEIYLAAAQSGLVAVPINFMLVGSEIDFILNHSEAKALFVQKQFKPTIDLIRGRLPGIAGDHYIQIDGRIEGDYLDYDELVKDESPPPEVEVAGSDPWMLIYTSGTTGTPKGALRSHDSYTSFYLINAAEFFFSEKDIVLNVMPLCHVNSTFYTLNVLYCGGLAYVHPSTRFTAEELMEVVDREKVTFISLVPTHYQLVLEVPEEKRASYDLSSLKKLLCSSAPAHKKTKLAIMDLLPGVQLYEAYGSTEGGLVTILRPHEQMDKLGSIGREPIGCDLVKILDPNGRELPSDEVGEIYSKSPMLFSEYLKDPDKTTAAFKNGWFSARDMGKQDEDGYFYIVDRKDNMIITGGEKVFPSEVEAVLMSHPQVYDAAIIGTPHNKWGEVVTAVVVRREGQEVTEQELVDFCDGKVGKFKRPKKVIFITDEQMPRTLTGKKLHRELRKQFGQTEVE